MVMIVSCTQARVVVFYRMNDNRIIISLRNILLYCSMKARDNKNIGLAYFRHTGIELLWLCRKNID